jgi:hypothetical protein
LKRYAATLDLKEIEKICGNSRSKKDSTVCEIAHRTSGPLHAYFLIAKSGRSRTWRSKHCIRWCARKKQIDSRPRQDRGDRGIALYTLLSGEQSAGYVPLTREFLEGCHWSPEWERDADGENT